MFWRCCLSCLFLAHEIFILYLLQLTPNFITPPRDIPIVGRDVSIVDAEEMEYPETMASGSTEGGDTNGNQSSHQAAILLKIELHQKVFPQHKVVGWYRVQKKQCDENFMNAEEDQQGSGVVMPSEDDLRMNQTEMARYCSGSTGEGEEDGESNSPLFVLMNAAMTEDDNEKKPSSSASASEEMEMDDELPLTVYETLSTSETSASESAVFVNADFELETYEPERIAVEKVFKTQPSRLVVARGASSTSNDRKTGKKSKKDGEKKKQQQQKSSYMRGPTELDSNVDSLQSSIRAMNIRINVLLEFLQRVERGEIEVDDALLRSVDGLVRQLPLVLAVLEEGSSSSMPLHELENEYNSTMLLSYLAAVAKTAKSVHTYSEKFRNACEGGKSDPRRPLY